MTVTLRYNGPGEAWLGMQRVRHQWSGPKAKAETGLRGRCLDGCYGDRCEALCMSYNDRCQSSKGKKHGGVRLGGSDEKQYFAARGLRAKVGLTVREAALGPGLGCAS